MIASCAGWRWRGGRLVPRTKPRTEARNVFRGSAQGCPCKCTPLAPADSQPGARSTQTRRHSCSPRHTPTQHGLTIRRQQRRHPTAQITTSAQAATPTATTVRHTCPARRRRPSMTHERPPAKPFFFQPAARAARGSLRSDRSLGHYLLVRNAKQSAQFVEKGRSAGWTAAERPGPCRAILTVVALSIAAAQVGAMRIGAAATGADSRQGLEQDTPVHCCGLPLPLARLPPPSVTPATASMP